MQTKLIFLMWVSGAGKSTILEKILTHTSYSTVNTTTTRLIRLWETDGVTYNFVTDERFDALIEQDDFIEYAWVHQKYRYGTRRSLVDKAMQSKYNVIKNLEIFGREQIVAKVDIKSYCYSIFMDIPDDEIVRRIVERDPRTTRDEIQRRLASTNYEREQSKLLCDHYVDVFGMSREEQYDYILNLIHQVTQE